MAMLESFLPQTNTFVVTNIEIGFSLKELSTITGLPILGNLYEEFMPIDSVLEEQSEEFRLLYFEEQSPSMLDLISPCGRCRALLYGHPMSD